MKSNKSKTVGIDSITQDKMSETLEKAHALADALENQDPEVDLDGKSMVLVARMLRQEIEAAQAVWERATGD